MNNLPDGMYLWQFDCEFGHRFIAVRDLNPPERMNCPEGFNVKHETILSNNFSTTQHPRIGVLLDHPERWNGGVKNVNRDLI